MTLDVNPAATQLATICHRVIVTRHAVKENSVNFSVGNRTLTSALLLPLISRNIGKKASDENNSCPKFQQMSFEISKRFKKVERTVLLTLKVEVSVFVLPYYKSSWRTHF